MKFNILLVSMFLISLVGVKNIEAAAAAERKIAVERKGHHDHGNGREVRDLARRGAVKSAITRRTQPKPNRREELRGLRKDLGKLREDLERVRQENQVFAINIHDLRSAGNDLTDNVNKLRKDIRRNIQENRDVSDIYNHCHESFCNKAMKCIGMCVAGMVAFAWLQARPPAAVGYSPISFHNQSCQSN